MEQAIEMDEMHVRCLRQILLRGCAIDLEKVAQALLENFLDNSFSSHWHFPIIGSYANACQTKKPQMLETGETSIEPAPALAGRGHLRKVQSSIFPFTRSSIFNSLSVWRGRNCNR